MMTVLLESAAPRRARYTWWTAASVAMHVVLIAAAVAVTAQARTIADRGDEPIIDVLPYEPPLPPEPQTGAARPMLPGLPGTPPFPTIPIPTVPAFDGTRPLRTVLPITSGDIFNRRGDSVIAASSGGGGGVHSRDHVERIASPLPGNGSPDYPRTLRAAEVEGSVVVTFVVDTTGLAEPTSIAIVSATHTLFADAVRQWLGRTRYIPAEIGGRRVRQLVQQEVGFSIRP